MLVVLGLPRATLDRGEIGRGIRLIHETQAWQDHRRTGHFRRALGRRKRPGKCRPVASAMCTTSAKSGRRRDVARILLRHRESDHAVPPQRAGPMP